MKSRKIDHSELSKREREIMNILIENSPASVADVIGRMRNPSSYSSIRTIMTIMFDKGLLIRKKEGKKYLYSLAISRKKAENSAIRELMATYFENSLESAVNALLRLHKKDLSSEYLDRLKGIIDRYEEEGG